MLDSHQDKDGSSTNEGNGPEEEDDQLDLPLGDDHFSSEGEADCNIPLHAEGGDVEDGGVGAALADELEELAEEVPKVPGPVLPEAEEVQGHAEEDKQVGKGHAGQVEVGGGPHVPEPRHHQHGHEVADDPDDEEEDAGDSDAGEHGRGEKVQRGLGARPVLRAAAARAPLSHPAAAGCASPPGAPAEPPPRSPASASAVLLGQVRRAGRDEPAPLRLSPGAAAPPGPGEGWHSPARHRRRGRAGSAGAERSRALPRCPEALLRIRSRRDEELAQPRSANPRQLPNPHQHQLLNFLHKSPGTGGFAPGVPDPQAVAGRRSLPVPSPGLVARTAPACAGVLGRCGSHLSLLQRAVVLFEQR